VDTNLNRLRLGFALLGCVLLTPLWFVHRAAEDRMEEQRRLRHEIVAERIFDEMERELGALLAKEAGRPSDAYAAQDTDVSSWSPFVLGYFTSDRASTRVIASAQLGSARTRRVSAAVATLWNSPDAPRFRNLAAEAATAQEGAMMRAAPSSRKQDDVLRQLNRARAPSPSKSQRDAKLDDPLMGL
jgi:hypothetical protein